MVVAAGATSKRTIVDATATAKTLLNRSNEDDPDLRDEPGWPPALGSGNEADTGNGTEDPATPIEPTSAGNTEAESETESKTEVEAAKDQRQFAGSRLRRDVAADNEKRAKPPRPPF